MRNWLDGHIQRVLVKVYPSGNQKWEVPIKGPYWNQYYLTSSLRIQIECTLKNFGNDTKLSDAADAIMGSGVIQNGLWQAWKVGSCKVQQGQLQAPVPAWGILSISTYWGKNGLRLWCIAGHESPMCTRNQERQLYPGLHKQKHSQQVK